MHTPGPWSIGRTDMRSFTSAGFPIHYVYRGDLETEHTRIGVRDFPGKDNCVEDARLIAAAPDLLAAIQEVLPTIEEWAKPQQGYGGFHGGDPRNFHPDGECSTEEERAAHKAACELADADEAGRELPCPSGWATIGEYRVHINRQPFGLGCYTYEDEALVKMRDTLCAAIAKAAP